MSRLLRGEPAGRQVTPELLRAIARACSDKAGYEFDPTPALALAGYVIAPSAVNLPPALLGILTAMEPWELDLLTIELPAWREQMRRLRDLVGAQRHNGLAAEPSSSLEQEEPSRAGEELRVSRSRPRPR